VITRRYFVVVAGVAGSEATAADRVVARRVLSAEAAGRAVPCGGIEISHVNLQETTGTVSAPLRSH
jgi:hypothetical protein